MPVLNLEAASLVMVKDSLSMYRAPHDTPTLHQVVIADLLPKVQQVIDQVGAAIEAGEKPDYELIVTDQQLEVIDQAAQISMLVFQGINGSGFELFGLELLLASIQAAS